MSAVTIEDGVLDQDGAEAFAGRAAEVLNTGAVAVMMSIGHRTGLFDVMAALPPSTSAAIAGRSGLAERYVREWLAVMVVGGIVDYEPASRTYALPKEHAASLTRGAPLGNLAVYAQNVALMGAMQDRILECFETGDGLGYHEYPHFHHVMEEDSSQTVTGQLFDAILPLAPDLAGRLEAGIDVLDAAGAPRSWRWPAGSRRAASSAMTHTLAPVFKLSHYRVARVVTSTACDIVDFGDARDRSGMSARTSRVAIPGASPRPRRVDCMSNGVPGIVCPSET